ncbi:fibronectin type III domain-containing protein [Actinoplanes sp. NPDC023936]|uniref:fibronectin type III domain-containing protein n=1 Tax=Actinoplanes sp. NPDC023936 TaxID=3154910 RepID=UPI003409CE16
MVRSIQRRCGAGLLAVVVMGLVAVVYPGPAEAVVVDGDISDVALYHRTSSGVTTRVSPDGSSAVLGDVSSGLDGSAGIEVDDDGTVYVTNNYTSKIYKIPPGGVATQVPFTTHLSSPTDVAVDGSGALYTTTASFGGVVRRAADGTETSFTFTGIWSIGDMVVDDEGSIYLLDGMQDLLVKQDAQGNQSTIAQYPDIAATGSLAIDDQKRLYVGSSSGSIYRITQGAGTVETITTAAGGVVSLAVAGNGDVLAARFTEDVVRVLADGTVLPALAQITQLNGLAVRTVPDPPDNVTATPGVASAGVSWDPAATNGGDPVVRYAVVSDPGGLTCVSNNPANTGCTVTGLANGQAYTFRVRASNSVAEAGESLLSAASGPVTPGLPSAPTSLQATPGDESAGISFLPGSPGADPNQDFETSTDQWQSWQPLTTAPGNGGTLTGTVTNLPNDVPTEIRLRGRNSFGPGPDADTTVVAVAPAPSASPSASPSVSPSASPSVSLSVSPSASSSPSLSASPSPPTTTRPPAPAPAPSSAPPTSSSPSPTATVTAAPTTPPAPTVPNPPTGVTVVAGTSSLQVSWQAPQANGVPVTGYRAIADPGPASCVTTGATNCVLGGTAGVPYRVRVVALSAKGLSTPSAYSGSATPSAPPVATTPPSTGVPLATDQGRISNASPGQDLTLVGTGYAAFSTVTLTVYSEPIVLAKVTTDRDGAFRQAVTVPGDLAHGTHLFTATGVDRSGELRTMRMDVTVRPKPSTLPVTGSSILWMLVTGLSLTTAGAALRSVGP